MDIKKWIGYTDRPRHWDYTYRDVVLSNLSFGAKSKDMGRIFARNDSFRAIPTFALIPTFGGVATPHTFGQNIPSAMIQIEAAGGDEENSTKLGLDWDHDLYIYRPIDPIKGTFMWHNKVDHIYDRGPGKGCVISNEATLRDETGRPVAKNYTRTVLFAEGGFGGEPVPKSEAVFPDCGPDYIVDEFMDDKTYLIYSIAGGGQAEIHIDEEWCKNVAHQPGIVIQGHLTLGYACRMAIDSVIPGEDGRMSHLYAQFRNPLFPNTNIQFRAWKVESQNKLYFKVVNVDDNDKIILNNGIFEWR